MALSKLGKQHSHLIHHSDRGIQYCSSPYVKLLLENEVEISMTENGDPLENAIAERINGIIKHEYLCEYQIPNINEARTVLDNVVKLYNEDRPHMSIGNLTPDSVHLNYIKTDKLWNNYYLNKRKPVIELQE